MIFVKSTKTSTATFADNTKRTKRFRSKHHAGLDKEFHTIT
jgi:hypothetical protein